VRRKSFGVGLKALVVGVLLTGLPIWSEENAAEILQRFVSSGGSKGAAADQYTYVEQADYIDFDKNGHAHKNRSETHDIIFVEGLVYKKLVARNGQPLEAKEQAKEEKRLRKTAEERRQERRSGLLHKQVSLGSDQELLTLFDPQLAGEEEIRGHQAWVVECTPKAGHVPAGAHEKEVLSFRRRLWIDKQESALVRSVSTVVGEHIFLMPGSTITWEFEKVNGEAWLPVSGLIEGQLQFAKFIKPRVRTEYTNSQFQKFNVESTITVEAVK